MRNDIDGKQFQFVEADISEFVILIASMFGVPFDLTFFDCPSWGDGNIG